MATAQSGVRRPIVKRDLSRFDLLLAAIPVALAAGIASSFVVSIPFFLGVATGAAVSAAVVGYSIYLVARAPPTAGERSTPRDQQPAIE